MDGLMGSIGDLVLEKLGVKRGPKSKDEMEEAKGRMNKDKRDTKSMNRAERGQLQQLLEDQDKERK